MSSSNKESLSITSSDTNTNNIDNNGVINVVPRYPSSNTNPVTSCTGSIPAIAFPTESSISENEFLETDKYFMSQSFLPSNSLLLTNRHFSSWCYEFEMAPSATGVDELSHDSIDMGDGGRINFRTGSFMTRFRRSSKAASGILNSGSPCVSSQEMVSSQSESAVAAQLGVQLDDEYKRCSSTATNDSLIEDELDPVLLNLRSDMDSLDNFRNFMKDENKRMSMAFKESIILLDENRDEKSGNEKLDFETHLLNKKIDDLVKAEKKSNVLSKAMSVTSRMPGDSKLRKNSLKKTLSSRKRNHPFRWSSLARSNQQDVALHDAQLYQLSITQLFHLKKLAVLKLTSLIQLHGSKSQFAWKFPKFLAGSKSKRSSNSGTSNTSQHSPISAADFTATAASAICLTCGIEPDLTTVTTTTTTSTATIAAAASTPSSAAVTSTTSTVPAGSSTTSNSARSSTSDSVFGRSLYYWQDRIGQPLPPAIYQALRYIRLVGPDSDGIFRRAGGKSRINELKRAIDENINFTDYTSWQPYDVADMVKGFFRALPECVMTNKLSSTLVSAFIHLSEDHWLEVVRWGIISLPDENRLVLQSMLYFLADLAKYSDKNQMNSYNLSVCMAPSLFHSSYSTQSISPIRIRKQHQGPDPKNLEEQKAVRIMLNLMIQHASSLFRVSEDTISKAHISMDVEGPPPLNKLLANDGRDWYSWSRLRIDALMNEFNHKFKNWSSVKKEIAKSCPAGMEISFYKKSPTNNSSNVNNSSNNSGSGGSTTGGVNKAIYIGGFGNSVAPRRQEGCVIAWKVAADIECDPRKLLDIILYKRQEWDPEVNRWSMHSELSDSADLVDLEFLGCPPEPPRSSVLLRGWQRNIEGTVAAVLVSQSVLITNPVPSQSLHPGNGTAASTVSASASDSSVAGEPHKGTLPSAARYAMKSANTIIPYILCDDVMIEKNIIHSSSTPSVSSSTSSSKCRIHWISRADMRGYSSDWYFRHWKYTLIRRMVYLKHYLSQIKVIDSC